MRLRTLFGCRPLGSLCFGGMIEDRFRYVILGLGFVALMSVSSNISTFNIAQVCMSNSTGSYSELHPFFAPIHYTPAKVSQLNAAIGLGVLIATIPISQLYIRFGSLITLVSCGLASALVTALIPFAAEMNFYFFLVLRFIQGICFAVDFPTVGALCSNWSPLSQTAIFIAILTSYSAFSTGLTDSIGGMLCSSSLGWPSIYFVHSAAGLAIFALLYIFYTDRPQDNRRVSAAELSNIQFDKSAAQIESDSRVPYRRLFGDFVILVIWLNAFAELLATNFLSAYAPYFLRNVAEYDAVETGHFAAIARVAQVPFRIASGFLSDRLSWLDERTKLLIFNSWTMFGSGLLFGVLPFVPVDVRLLYVVDFAAVNAVCGAASAGFYKAAALYGRQYAQFILSTFQFLKSIGLFLGPALFAAVVSDEHSGWEWARIWFMFAVSLIIANILFLFYATDRPAAYTTAKEAIA